MNRQEPGMHPDHPLSKAAETANYGLNRPILKGEINFPVCLAPMVGLTHVAFRRVVRDYLPEGARTIWPTEMLNSRRVPGENLKTTPETMRADCETHLVPQILGNEEKPIRESVLRLHDWGAVGIDINMGCPVKKALSHNYGVALMGDPDYAAEVTRVTASSTSLPVSVKLRAAPMKEGADLNEKADIDYLVNFIKGLEQAGASWLTLHPRTAGQKRRGRADWNQIALVRSKVQIPIIGNGDVQTASDALRMLTETGCDMTMIGRALTARPWLLWQVGEVLGFPPPPGRTGRAPATPEEEGAEYGRSLLRLLELVEEHFVREELALRKFRFFVRTSSPWLPFGNQLYGAVMKGKTYAETKEGIERFFSNPHAMSQRTELRQ